MTPWPPSPHPTPPCYHCSHLRPVSPTPGWGHQRWQYDPKPGPGSVTWQPAQSNLLTPFLHPAHLTLHDLLPLHIPPHLSLDFPAPLLPCRQDDHHHQVWASHPCGLKKIQIQQLSMTIPALPHWSSSHPTTMLCQQSVGYGTAQNIRKVQHKNKKIFHHSFSWPTISSKKNKYEVQTHMRLILVINLY